MSVPIVYWYPCRWDMPPSRHRYLMEAMSEQVPVVFLNQPSFSRRIEAKRPRAERVHDNLTLIHDAFGFRLSRLGSRLGRIAGEIDGRWLNGLLRSLGYRDYVYWLSAAAPLYIWGMRTDRLVWDCIDPCFLPSYQETFDRNERIVAQHTKLVFCTADVLVEKVRTFHSSVHLLPNACHAESYHPDYTRDLALPAALKGRPRPIVAYMGTFDWRVDVAVLTEAARRLPEVTFALAGRINPDQEEKVRQLRALPNVVMPGSVSEEEGRAFITACDVGLIPYLAGPMNDAVNPIKMYMYLVAGKPVVANDLLECRKHPDLVHTARNPDEFVGAIRQALQENSPAQMQARIDFAMQNTWRDRARTALSLLREAGLMEERVTARKAEATV